MDALYLADSEATLWAEWYRHLAERAVPPLAQMPRAPWTWLVDVEVADLSTAERLSTASLMPPTPGQASWRPYQRVGERLAREGWIGLLAPSAAHPAGRVLCLFREGSTVRGASPVGRPRTIKAPPAPPRGLRT